MEYIDIDKLKIYTPYDLITDHMANNTSGFVMEKSDLALYF